MKLLGVNIDHVATIRQLRHVPYPDLLEAANLVHLAGADSITVHLRQDRRHIQDSDVLELHRETDIPLNLEMVPTQEMVDFALKIKPTYCCLLMERPEELTTEGGLDVHKHAKMLEGVVGKLTEAGIVVSLFIDPEIKQIEAAKSVGAPVVELRTGEYAHAKTIQQMAHQLERIKKAAEAGEALGLNINAGHGLHYSNTQAIVSIPQIRELNIGHAIIARAILVGLSQAVEEMAAIVHAQL